MQNHEVIPAFEMLIEELDAIVSDLNQQGAQYLSKGEYDQARSLIAKVESITTIRDKVQTLQVEWRSLQVSETRGSPKKRESPTERLKHGLRTPEKAFITPILQTLIKMGGNGKVSDILDHMELSLKPILNDYDYQLMNATKQPSWRTTAKWARQALVNEGKLASDSPRGIWEITEQGRAWVEEQTKELNQEPVEKQTATAIPKVKPTQEERSVALEQIIEVCHEIYHNGRDYNEALQQVADRRGLRSVHTVADKCTRQLGINTAEFKSLTDEKFKLMKFLIDQFPKDQYYIIEQLGS